MRKVIKRTVIRRFLEFLFWEVVLSVVVTALTTAEGTVSRYALVGLTFTGICVYALINVLFQRRCCLDLADKNLYYETNFIAYAMFIFTNILAMCVLDNVLYTWLFALTKAIRYLYIVIPLSVSALVFHIIMLVAVYVSPYGMDTILHVVRDSRNMEKHIMNRRHAAQESEEEEELFNIPEDRRRIID